MVIRGLKTGATLAELLEALEFEAGMHGLAAPWGVSLTAELLTRAAEALRERAGPEGLAQLALATRPAGANPENPGNAPPASGSSRA